MTQAIFLSHASQGADAARRICESLRVARLKVWFDQSELRGGDAWDASIRKQIKECALFIPIITPNTQARVDFLTCGKTSHAITGGGPISPVHQT